MSITRKVISKSAKRKMPSSIEFPIFAEGQEGKSSMKKVMRFKAGTFTEMVVYHEKLSNGNIISNTKHEMASR